MLFGEEDEEEILDLNELFKDISIENENPYISNAKQAINLIGRLIKNESSQERRIINKINQKIDELFDLLSTVSLANELEYYQKFRKLSNKLLERNKVGKIADRTILAFGGRVSAGKSRFINSIAKVGDLLPVNQAPTTSIPSYIVAAKEDKISANSIYGYSCPLSKDEFKAITHEFHDEYQIGFSAFVESIVIESNAFSLGSNIALLDTPGYSKADNKSVIIESDKEKAFSQLSISEHLIWLADIENGTLTVDDIEFLESLNMSTEILIVFTQSDKKTETVLKETAVVTQNNLEKTNIPCYGIAFHSSVYDKEYFDNKIERFIQNISENGCKIKDIYQQFIMLEKDLRQELTKANTLLKRAESELFSYIQNSKNVLEIQSASQMWGESNKESYKFFILMKQYDELIVSINQDVKILCNSKVET